MLAKTDLLRLLGRIRSLRSRMSSSDVEGDFYSNALYAAVMKTEDFQRLSGISFLGILSHVDGKGIKNTRADHSIRVGILTYYFCRLAKVSEKIQHLLVVSGLLHDIHHLPFSHTMENAIAHELAHFSLGYETKRILFSGKKASKSVGDTLKEHGLDWQALPILKPKSRRMLVFGSTHNVDTIDGITRAQRILFPDDSQKGQLADLIVGVLSKAAVSSSLYSHAPDDSHDTELLDVFWELKNKVYEEGIYEPKTVLFERVIGYYLFNLCWNAGLLDRLTQYRDQDFFDLFPGLSEKIQLVWRHIQSGSVVANTYSSKDSPILLRSNVGNHLCNEPISIPTRRFVINKDSPLERTKGASWKKRYCVEPHRVVFIGSTDFTKGIEDILETPSFWERIQRTFSQRATPSVTDLSK